SRSADLRGARQLERRRALAGGDLHDRARGDHARLGVAGGGDASGRTVMGISDLGFRISEVGRVRPVFPEVSGRALAPALALAPFRSRALSRDFEAGALFAAEV